MTSVCRLPRAVLLCLRATASPPLGAAAASAVPTTARVARWDGKRTRTVCKTHSLAFPRRRRSCMTQVCLPRRCTRAGVAAATAATAASGRPATAAASAATAAAASTAAWTRASALGPLALAWAAAVASATTAGVATVAARRAARLRRTAGSRTRRRVERCAVFAPFRRYSDGFVAALLLDAACDAACCRTAARSETGPRPSAPDFILRLPCCPAALCHHGSLGTPGGSAKWRALALPAPRPLRHGAHRAPYSSAGRL